jgi:hypothetical protein
VDRTAIPADLPGRAGEPADLDLVAEVDAPLGRSRADDARFLLERGARMEVVDAGDRRGFVVHRKNRLVMLGATDECTASQVLWRFLAETDGKASVWCMTAQQDWAVRVTLAARMTVLGAGPLFLDGLERPPGPWLPSGWYF